MSDPVAARGEVKLTLEGHDFVLRPSFEAIGAIEAATGKTVFELAAAAEKMTMTLADAGVIVAHCVRAQAKATGNKLHENAQPEKMAKMIYGEPGGLLVAIRTGLYRLLMGALIGGYTASGEPRQTETTT